MPAPEALGGGCGLVGDSALFGGSPGVFSGLSAGVGGCAAGCGDSVGIVWSAGGTEAGCEWGFGKGDGAADGGDPTEGTVSDSCVRGYDGGPP